MRWVGERLLCALVTVAAVLLAARAFLGPFAFVHSPLNVACMVAVGALAMVALRGGVASGARLPHPRWTTAAVFAAALAAFAPTLTMPAVSDDFVYMQQARDGNLPAPHQCLYMSNGGPRFFRPIGTSLAWLEWRLWATNAAPRHALDMLLHAASSVLFLWLLRRLGVGFPFDLLGALLFAWHGVRPEAVAWPAARFDTLALLFGLAAALAVLRGNNALSLVSTAAACLSKEAGFVVPLLVAIVLAGRARRLIAGHCAVAAGIFAWRWMVVRGIGGYWGASPAEATVFAFQTLTFVKTFFWRIWGALWFPLNWAVPMAAWTAGAVALCGAASAMLARARVNRWRMGACVLAAMVACLPTHHMLLLGASFERSRYLTLASPAIIAAIVFACASMPRRWGAMALGAFAVAHLGFQQHNLNVWRKVSAERVELVRGVATRARATVAPIAIVDLPLVLDGVYWRNGVEQALTVEHGIPMSRVRVNEAPQPGDVVLRWDGNARRLLDPVVRDVGR